MSYSATLPGCTKIVQDDDPADAERIQRIQRICAQLTDLISSSADQRRALDKLLDEAQVLAERIANARARQSP
jgi:hypothetical protein